MSKSPLEMAWLLQNACFSPAGSDPHASLLQAATVLESEPGSRFDDFSFLAAHTLRTPIGGISLVDGPYHWLRSADGFKVSRRSRTDPFCIALMNIAGQVLLVEDVLRDPVLSRSQLVRSLPFIRSYAGIALRDPAGHFLGTIFVADTVARRFDEPDITALRAVAVGLETVLALHDSVVSLCRAVTCDFLTGLLNRAPFELKLRKAVSDAALESSCVLICLDLDNFKEINDRLGHAAGDAVLVEAARRLTLALRRTDYVARLSGDEFAVLMLAPATLEDAAALMTRILGAVGQSFQVCGATVNLSLSLGAALSPNDAEDFVQLMRRADIALYEAKNSGGGCYRIYDPASEAVLTERNSLRADLKLAVEENQFSLAWQPIVAAASGAIRGYEVLLRWNRPLHGPTSPDVFISLAEEMGLIVAIDTWVIARACEFASTLPGQLRVAVNVWPGWFGSGRLSTMIGRALGNTGCDPSRLEIEVTERALIAKGEAALLEMLAIKALGVRLVLDDFGNGYSSLLSLSTFPFDCLKLDAAFVQELCVSDRSRRVALHVLQLGHELGAEVCAEGVENELQRSILQHDRYDWLQGYLIGRPAELPVESVDDPAPALAHNT